MSITGTDGGKLEVYSLTSGLQICSVAAHQESVTAIRLVDLRDIIVHSFFNYSIILSYLTFVFHIQSNVFFWPMSFNTDKSKWLKLGPNQDIKKWLLLYIRVQLFPINGYQLFFLVLHHTLLFYTLLYFTCFIVFHHILLYFILLYYIV